MSPHWTTRREERRKGKAYGLLPQCRFVIRDNVTNVTSSLPSLSPPEIEMLLAHSSFEIGSLRGFRLFSTTRSYYGDECFCHSCPVSVGCYPQSPDDRESDYVSEAFFGPLLGVVKIRVGWWGDRRKRVGNSF